ncbi:MAG: hypothetical protein JW844_02375 [Candidatus Omnitrophica bacterium]|nr:hypothetical protein [Candidatus Omnitrophota bacterium]
MIKKLYNLKIVNFKNTCVASYRRNPYEAVILFSIFLCISSAVLVASLKILSILNGLSVVGPILVDRLMYVLLMIIFLMLIISSIIVSFSTLYNDKEVDSLIFLPLPVRSIFLLKGTETVVYSAWGFIFLFTPFFVAYGIVLRAPNIYYVFLIPCVCLLSLLATSIGLSITLILTRLFIKYRTIVLFVISVYGSYALYSSGIKEIRLLNKLDPTSTIAIINSLVPNIRFSQWRLLPSFWCAEGLSCFIQGSTVQGLFYSFFLCMNTVFTVRITLLLSRLLFYAGWEGMQTAPGTTQKTLYKKKSLLDCLCIPLKITGQHYYAFIKKDIKMFWRDPFQRTQCILLFGLLAFYFGNLRSFQGVIINDPIWKNIIWFLNLGATNLILGTLAARFAFPQFSLEGKCFWVLGLAPIELKKLFFQKLLLNACAALCLVNIVISISSKSLNLSSSLLWLGILMTSLMSLCITTISVGFGVIFIDLKEEVSAKIVSGMGGTLTLIFSLMYIIMSIALIAIPIHLMVTKRLSITVLKQLEWGAGMLLVTISILSISLIIRCALHKISRLEF